MGFMMTTRNSSQTDGSGMSAVGTATKSPSFSVMDMRRFRLGMCQTQRHKQGRSVSWCSHHHHHHHHIHIHPLF